MEWFALYHLLRDPVGRRFVWGVCALIVAFMALATVYPARGRDSYADVVKACAGDEACIVRAVAR
jgi:hypothetical protein